MLSKEKYKETIKSFRKKYALESTDENIIVIIHLKNVHSLDENTALDQTSNSSADEGIDGWHFEEKSGELYIYQSKYSESKNLVKAGLNDLKRAKDWLEKVLITGKLEYIPKNKCLYNLYVKLSQKKDEIKKINFILVSLFNSNELEDTVEYDEFEKEIITSKLMEYISNRNGKLNTILEEYNFESSLPRKIKKYAIKIMGDSRIDLRKNAYLSLSYMRLYDLIELYRQRGDILFDKNVRLSLMNTKEAKERLQNPLKETFDNICKGIHDTSIFPFYHIGITIYAKANESDGSNDLALESPYIINGCQTITIAENYLRQLENKNNQEYLERFKEIKVIAKIVIGTKDEELREITNANNRQNPIENWQLFSNEPIHIEIEYTLKELGIFYERQKGKFITVMKHASVVGTYPYTNNTFIEIESLGKIVCLARGNLQWAAKPSEIFINKKNHDSIFDEYVIKCPIDIIFINNLFLGIKRALTKYLEYPVHSSNEGTQIIFRKPIIRAYMHYIAVLFFYQTKEKDYLRRDYSMYLNKIAPPNIVSEVETFFRRIITKTREWYMGESKNLEVNVSSKNLDILLKDLCEQVGVDLEEGHIPFSDRSIDWSEYKDKND